ncbi:PREDICTED: cytochrome b5 reductase 4 [Myotis davidii]|uniref:cytochrome b5 reductase 4 n=1 Tax=Myotis davidii TaxID=225400 RepID=UPI00076765F5|nr:PREDICTED: cytochrome b5 reductase 4 [Myotis davidii]
MRTFPWFRVPSPSNSLSVTLAPPSATRRAASWRASPRATPEPAQQRAASGGRSKVPLKQGRSLMDWIRLTKSGKDLTGLKGRLIEVTEEELKKHNKKDDCWICIRGFVYNVSPYMEYHPGGEDELMKAAGSDGTDLFDQVHRWVNYESMLKECLVGRMAVKPAVPKDYHEEKKVLNELSHAIQEDFSVRVVANVGKIEIVLKKKENTSWECLGHPLENHNSLIPKKDTGLYYRKCQLISKEDATHDTKLFYLMLPPSTHLQVPIGQHVYLKLTIAGTEIVKPYTPVSASLLSEFKEPVIPNNKYIYFLIKIYPAGLFTPELDHLQIGDFVSVSNPEGNFKISQCQELEDLFLLAAGTGFTPMVKILNYALTNISSLRKMKLMFFNKTEDDIIWRSQLEKLAFKDKRFDVEFVLSKPTSEWNGKKGHISLDLLSEFLKRSLDKSKVLICICGPMPFTEQGMRMLHDLNFSKDEIHGFTA